MFAIDHNINDLNIKEKNIAKMLFSMNSHHVATPEMTAEEARSYIIFLREAGGKLLAYVGLYFVNSDRKLFYTHSANSFPETDMADVENEARSFAEDLGAMLDELDLSKMTNEEKDQWIDQQDIFSTKKKDRPAAAEPVPVAASSEQPQPAAPVESEGAAEAVSAAQPGQPVPSAGGIPQTEAAVPAQTAVPSQDTAPAAPAPPAAEPVLPAAPVQPPAASLIVTTPASAVQPGPAVPGTRPMAPPRPQPSAAVQQPKKKPAAAQPRSAPPVPERASSIYSERLEEVLEQAVTTGAVSTVNAQAKKTASPSEVVSREKEALARLFASF